MPERSFGRTVRYRRTKLGLSQAKLGELVGRSATTVRSWERDQSHPNDTNVLTALAAILGVDERRLFEKAGQEAPEVESTPTIEQELATLDPELAAGTDFRMETPEEEPRPEPAEPRPEPAEPTPEPAEPDQQAPKPEPNPPVVTPPPDTQPDPAYVTPPPSYVVTTAVPPVHEPSYMEDSSQRQLYRIRNLATIVFLVALGIALIWALGEGFGAIGDWWDDFFGNLRL